MTRLLASVERLSRGHPPTKASSPRIPAPQASKNPPGAAHGQLLSSKVYRYLGTLRTIKSIIELSVSHYLLTSVLLLLDFVVADFIFVVRFYSYTFFIVIELKSGQYYVRVSALLPEGIGRPNASLHLFSGQSVAGPKPVELLAGV